MALNWKEIDLILNELELENSFIQKIRQPDFHSLVLDIYSRSGPFQLFISLKQGETRLHSLSHPVKTKVKLQRFAQFLRSRIQGGRITAARQIERERIIELQITRGEELTFLFIRLWGGAANIIAADSGCTILDAFYRRPKRNEITGAVYNPRLILKNSTAGQPDKTDEYHIREYNRDIAFNKCIENVYQDKQDQETHEQLLNKITKFLDQEEAGLERQTNQLKARQKEYADYQSLKMRGDLITSNLHVIQNGAPWVVVENYYHDNREYKIELDPKLSPEENAQKYYKRYSKAKQGLKHVEEELENTVASLNRVRCWRKELFRPEPVPTEKLQEFADRRQITTQNRKQEQIHDQRRVEQNRPPGLQFQSGEFTIYLGRSAKENDELLRYHVRGNDLWLHTRDYAGGYVFIKFKPGKSVPLETLLDAGNLALHFSKGRSGGKGELYYTQVKYLRRAKKGKPGLVIPTQEKNLTIQLDHQRISRLLGKEEAADD